MDNYHLTHDGDDWKLKKEGAKQASKVFKDMTKVEATQATSDFMQNHPGSVKIHKLDGTFQEERTYPRSADPKQSPG